MKKIFIVAGVMLLTLGACTNESLLPDNTNDNGVTKTRSARMSFNVTLPGGDPITYAEIQTAIEKKVERLDIYQFGEGTDGRLEAVFNNVQLTSAATGYSVSLDTEGSGKKQFMFVANNQGSNNGSAPSIENLANGTITAGEFMKKITKELGDKQLNGAPLLMTAHLEDVEVKTGTVGKKAELERIMSRIDIKNYEPKLTITRVRLEQVPDRSFLFNQAATTQHPTGMKWITLPEVKLPTQATTVGSSDPVEMEKVAATSTDIAHTDYKHVFYPYVSDDITEETQAPLIVIEGILFKGDPNRESKVIYKKRLKIDGQSKFLGFKRNTRYTLLIKKAFRGEVDASIVVDKWNEETVEGVIKPVAPVAYELSDSHVYYTNFSWDADEQTLKLTKIIKDKESTSGYGINEASLYISCNVDWEYLVEGDAQAYDSEKQVNNWLTVYTRLRDMSIANGVFIKNELRFRATADNLTGQPRTVRLILRNKVDHNKQSIITITQEG
ncbi:hypothetical protein ETF27_04950 [Prevotella brunnea]|uniref:Major fimbrial subunit protein N-terminal domain-containing protein n=1 Tax=Prevotella brunnea TaxID=2508867 RepID=A0A5C8GKR4_9BACT|nr:hypothetical protein [Prevotella brunnea]TXJ62351.1 hypothetical protein ETF27_04950 [Prevotella brunnea]